jgi:hypothetical protein
VDLAQALRRAGDVEVAQDHAPEPVRGSVPAECPLERALGLAIGVDRAERGVLGDGRGVRDAVHRGGGREHEAAHAAGPCRLEQGDASGHVVAVFAGSHARRPRPRGGEDRLDPSAW